MKRIVSQTVSVCPECLKRIPASQVIYGDQVFLEKECEEHGFFKTLIWRGAPSYEGWKNGKKDPALIHETKPTEKGCPYDCGLCTKHRQRSCCVLLEVTRQCNLKCPICFASAGEGSRKEDPSLEIIGHWYDELMKSGGPFNIQLSGGEPTQRDDLVDIIGLGKEKGFDFFQLNTNGIRLAEDNSYGKELKKAGLSCVFLQFDGFKESTYQALRGMNLLEIKQKAIENCKAAHLGVVLVPTLAPNVNIDEIGEILNFAVSQMPVVRGVHFQPISYFGRYHGRGEDRFTLPDLLREIEKQTEGRMKIEDFSPGAAEHAYCSFRGNFLLSEEGNLKPWNSEKTCGCGSEVSDAAEASKKAQAFVAKQWAGRSVTEGDQEENCGQNTASLDQFLERLETYTLAVSSMVFMDSWNLDLERLKECYIHVVSQQRDLVLIPFCSYNLTALDGTTLYRESRDETIGT